ncbi:hypothetical protein OY14_00495 [Borreliella chilensis]|uniref:Uncharacterized protein n=1 Tax=Borreliella chilensis TaxID=1245910 RepID=A0A0A7UX13_9SPIR|nr:hypothetical protein OY14_00495 [Borreliella chilensis]
MIFSKIYKLMPLFLFVTTLFPIKDKELSNKLELFSNVETSIKKNPKTYNKNSNSQKESIFKKDTNSNIYIQKSKKINYPNKNLSNNTNQKSANKSDRHFFFATNSYVKVYPRHQNDTFEAIKNTNKFPVKTEKTHALIGPILKDNLGIIIKMLQTKGYTTIEYIENNN